jgi:hypothetical protein
MPRRAPPEQPEQLDPAPAHRRELRRTP